MTKFSTISLYNETLRHIELCKCIISQIQRNPPKLFKQCTHYSCLPYIQVGVTGPPPKKTQMFVTFSLALPACLSTIRDRLAPRLSDMTADLVSLCIAIYIYISITRWHCSRGGGGGTLSSPGRVPGLTELS